MSASSEFASWDTSTQAMAIGLGVGSIGVAGAWAGVGLWALANDMPAPHNLPELFSGLADGVYAPAKAWIITVLTLMITLVAGGVIAWKIGRPHTRGDDKARLTGSTSEIAPLLEQSVKNKAKRLHPDLAVFGFPVAKTVNTNTWMFSSFEDVCLNISGPRTGKTTCWVVPRILAAPGAVVATSNKRDIVDSTIKQREARGKVFVFDPQAIADTKQTFWWNPLSYVTDPVSAVALAKVFADTTRKATATTSAFFDGAAKDLIAGLILAAAVADKPLVRVHRWLNNQNDPEPADILRDAGYDRMAQSVEGIMNLVHETRSGVYGGAAQIMSFLVNDQAMRWVTPCFDLKEFNPDQFVKSTDTLYCLSQEGKGSAAPIVTALTVAVVEAAVNHAKTGANGRLHTPMLIELDEAANVCRWADLPDLYSHFGSRGICVDTVLQSYSQGQAVWGDEGIRKLWSAANVKIYGGGVSERDFLAQLEALIGVHYIDAKSVSYSKAGRSTSTNTASQQRSIATVADLAAMPQGRAWVFASGATPTLARLIPYWQQKTTSPSAKTTNKKRVKTSR